MQARVRVLEIQGTQTRLNLIHRRRECIIIEKFLQPVVSTLDWPQEDYGLRLANDDRTYSNKIIDLLNDDESQNSMRSSDTLKVSCLIFQLFVSQIKRKMYSIFARSMFSSKTTMKS